MRLLSKITKDEDLRKTVTFVVVFALFFLSHCVGYDAKTGWHWVDHPFPWNVSRLTKREVLSLIDQRQIKNYGVRDCEILMRSKDQKWLSLDSRGNNDVLRRLGEQSIDYIQYRDDDWF